MDLNSLSTYLDPVLQAVVGIDGESVVYANPAAMAVFGHDICSRPVGELISEEILNDTSPSFSFSTLISGKPASACVFRNVELTLIYLSFIPEEDIMRVTPQMMNYLRNCATGIKMSADRCFDITAGGKNEKYVSVLYHYYYCLLRGITQMDNALKLEKGEFSMNTTSTDLVSLCYELTDTVAKMSESTGVDIEFQCDEPSIYAVVDPVNIELVLLNLFSNSLKNASGGGHITLSLSKTNENILISLDDDGRGIPKDKLSRVFDINYDEFDIGSPGTGLGLGLFICGSIIRLHNGVMLIESREDEGTHVRIKLPANGKPSVTFKTPETTYRSIGVSPVLTALSDVLKNDSYGPKFED